MQLDPCLGPQPADNVKEPAQVGRAVDLSQRIRGGRLNADLKAEGLCRYLFQDLDRGLVQEVSGDLEVKVAALVVLQDETPNLICPAGIIVERAVDQLDLRHFFLHQQQQVAFDALHGVGTHLPFD